MLEGKDLSDAFRELAELEEDLFDINSPEDINELKDELDQSDEDSLEDVIDPLATTEEELQDSYVGKVILDCVVCQSKLYKNAEEVNIDEEQNLANIGDECPYCQSADGYRIIGEVAPYSKTDVDVEVTPKEDGSEEANIDVTSDEKEEDNKKEESLKKVKELAESKNGKLLKESLIGATVYDILDMFIDDSISDVEIYNFGTGDTIINGTVDDIKNSEYADKELESIEIDRTKPGTLIINIDDELNEALNNINIDTDKETINVTATEKQEEGEEMIAPVEPETEEKFNKEEPEDSNEEAQYQDVDIDEFDENEFDELGENYLKRVYENVASYKTTKGVVAGNQLKLEGLIKFKSGKQAKTNFVFEAKTINKNGKLKLIGENKQFARGNKSFTLSGKLNGKKLIAESLTYNYRAKDSKSNTSKRLYGTVRK